MRPKNILGAVGAILTMSALAPAALLAAGESGTAPGAPGAGATSATAARDVAIARRKLDVVAGTRAIVSGHVAPAAADHAVTLQRHTGDGWRTIDRDRTSANGAFAFRFRPQEPGSAKVRVRAGAARESVGRLNVYRFAQVSWYGPGLYGAHLGCGGTLSPGTLGVAHKSLPCGTKVTLRHNGRTVRVPVVDRGPYVGGREFDLTAATKARLDFSGVGTVLVAV